MTFVDDYCRNSIIYLVKEKNEIFDKLQEFVIVVTSKFQDRHKSSTQTTEGNT